MLFTGIIRALTSASLDDTKAKAQARHQNKHQICTNIIKLIVCEYVRLLPVNSASLIVSPHTTHILNQHDPRSALVHISGALTAC